MDILEYLRETSCHQNQFFILDSERSDEYIDFTMIFSFVLKKNFCDYTISSRNNISIFNFSVLFDGKVNLVSGASKSLKFLVIFKSTMKTKTKRVVK